MTPRFRHTAAVIAACQLMLAGCNDEVFVRPLPEPSAITLSPEGNRISVDIDVKGAQELNLTTDTQLDYINLYRLDAAGDTVGMLYDTAVALPAGIAVGTRFGDLRALADTRGRIRFTTGELLSTREIEFNINVLYSYGAVSIPVIVPGIEPFTVSDIAYGHSSVRDDNVTENTETLRYTNNSDDTIRVELHPYLNVTTRVTFAAEASHPELPVAAGREVEVPTTDASGVAAMRGFTCPYLPGIEQTLPSGLPDKAVYIKLPPRTTRRYHIFINRMEVRAFYTATLATPSLAGDRTQKGVVFVDCPTGYLIGYNDDPYDPYEP